MSAEARAVLKISMVLGLLLVNDAETAMTPDVEPIVSLSLVLLCE